MSIQFTPDTPATRRTFNRLAREKMKLHLLADIRMDLMVCELEGYSKLEYLDELLALVQELRKGGWGMMDDTKSKSSPICIEVKAQYKRSELGRKLERVQKAQAELEAALEDLKMPFEYADVKVDII